MKAVNLLCPYRFKLHDLAMGSVQVPILPEHREQFRDFNNADHFGNKTPKPQGGFGYLQTNITLNDGSVIRRESFSFRSSQDERKTAMYTLCAGYSSVILRNIGMVAGLQVDSSIRNSVGTMTSIRYPPGSYGTEPHRDWGLITLIYTDAMGLQCKYAGKWLDVPVLDDHLVVNIGSSLNIISNNRLRAPVHRVLSTREKRSTAFFLEPMEDFMIVPGLTYKRYHDHMMRQKCFS